MYSMEWQSSMMTSPHEQIIVKLCLAVKPFSLSKWSM